MGPNRQRKPREVRGRGRGGGRGRGSAPAPVAGKPIPSMMSNAGRDMIIDVLQHAATAGAVPVPEKHFDSSVGTRITLHRNAPLTPTETLQRIFEGLGFPRDLVTQYMTDLMQNEQVPAFTNVMELMADDGPLQPFLVQSCFELFSCMTWFHREQAVDDGKDGTEDDAAAAEEGDALLEEELETISSLFSDTYIGKRYFSDADTQDRELYFSFMTSEDKPVLAVIRIPDYYPTEPPQLYLQPLNGRTSLDSLTLAVAPSCTRELSAASRRAVMDAAIEAINGFTGTGCLMALASAIGGVVSSVTVAPPEDTTAARLSREVELRKRQEAADQRKAFVGALKGGAGQGEEDEGQDRFLQFSMPEKVEMQVVDGSGPEGELVRRQFLARDAQSDRELKSAWESLQTSGTLSTKRRDLPAFQMRDQLRQALASSNVVVIGGETGSGKTTQIPQYLYEFMCEDGKGSAANIVCTQPRRLAATSVAIRVAEERDEAVGGTVGYTIRLENCVSKRTQIAYCTTGIVLHRLQTDKFLGRVSHVVVDEIHERGVDTDFLLILLRDLLTKRSDLKVILMSATMDSDLFARYFGGAPVIGIKGRTFPVNVMHIEQIIPTTRYILEDGSPYSKPSANKETRRRNTRKNVLNLDLDEIEEDAEQLEAQRSLAKQVKASPATIDTLSRMNLDVINYELIESIVVYIESELRIEGAVLVFLPGMAEIQRCMEQLKDNPALARSCLFYNLHSSLGSSEQQGVFRKPPRGKRKVILGTNIMETSITIDDAVFVIDTGKAKENRYNARKSLSELVTVNVSKANCRQRQGRAGRVREGYCFRLFTEAQFDSFDDHQLCEMHRVPLESLILQIYSLHLGDEVAYLKKALTPPEERAINSSVKVLTTIGALTAEKRLTSLGQHLANLPLDVRVGKMIIHGALLHCLDPVVTMSACLSVRSPFLASMDFRSEVEAVKRAFGGEHMSDHLASWFAYNRWVSALHNEGPSAARKLCTECYLSPATLTQIQATKKQYERYLYEAGFIDGARKNTSLNKFSFEPYVTMDNRVYEAGGAAFNTNSGSARCILSCLVAGLYPNVARVKKQRHKDHNAPTHFITFDGSDCLVHPSSVAGKGSRGLPTQLLVYVDKIKTSCTFLREVSFVMPLHIILFGGGTLEYLQKYNELCVDEVTAFQCKEEDATLLMHLKTQLDSALTQKINDPSQSWESVSAMVVKAIVKLLKDDSGASKNLLMIDRRAPRAPLTENMLPEDPKTGRPTGVTVPDDQPFKTSKSCFLCGETGHVSRFCPHSHANNKNGPPVRCFICGQWHFPQDCKLAAPLKR